MNNNDVSKKIPMMMAMSVGAVLFSAHAGGGFATGNQANTYYIGLGWFAPIAAIFTMLLLTLTMREAMIMYNTRGLTSYKDLFKELYKPFDKLSWIFDVFFYIMVLMAVAAAISSAASALVTYIGLNYYIGIVIVGAVILTLTIFGANVVRKAASYMGLAILISAISIYTIGIIKGGNIGEIFTISFSEVGFSTIGTGIKQSFVYAGFQCVTLPTMIACGTQLVNKKACGKAMWFSFVINSLALVLSVVMLLSWESVYTSIEGGTVIPTLTTCYQLGMPLLVAIYGVCLLLCLVSTGVTTTFGFVARFEKLKVLSNIKSPTKRAAVVSTFIIVLSVTISLVGLTNIIKYGYGYCGYLGIIAVVVPFLTVGVYKNRKFLKENPEYIGE